MVDGIPQALWTPLGTLFAGIFAACVAFIAVMLQNRSAERRHRAELKHDAEQRNLERLGELRKLVYLDGLDAVGSIESVMTDLWNISVPGDDIKQRMAKSTVSLMRLRGIAGIEITRALDDANAKILEVIPIAFSIRASMEKWKLHLDKVRKIYDDSMREHDEIVKRLKEDASLTSDQRTKLEAERDRLREIGIAMGKRTVTNLGHEADARMKIAALAHEKGKAYTQAQSRVVLAIRKELGFEVDEASLSAYFEASADESHKLLRSALERIYEEYKAVVGGAIEDEPRPEKAATDE